MVNADAEDDHLQGIALLSASFTPSLEHVAKVIEVAQVRLGGAHGFKICKHITEFFTGSLERVSLLKPACVVA